MKFIPSIVRVNGERVVAISRTERIPIGAAMPSDHHCGKGSSEPIAPVWPAILRNDRAAEIRICESCSSFSTGRGGCPRCAKIGGKCAQQSRYKTAIMARAWPEGCPQQITRSQEAEQAEDPGASA